MAALRSLDDEVMEAPFNMGQFKRLLAYLKPYKKQIAFSFLLMISASVCSLLGPYLMSRAIGNLQEGNGGPVPYLILGMILAVMIGAWCLRKRVRVLDTAGRKAIATLRQDLFSHIQDLSLPLL